MRTAIRVASMVMIFGLSGTCAEAADLAFPHHRHLPLPGYAYGGYGNGPGSGWAGARGPGYAPGISPGYGYIPAGAPPTIFDLGY